MIGNTHAQKGNSLRNSLPGRRGHLCQLLIDSRPWRRADTLREKTLKEALPVNSYLISSLLLP